MPVHSPGLCTDMVSHLYVFSCVGLVSIAEKNVSCICRNDKVSPQCASLCVCRGCRPVRMPVHSPGLCTDMVSHLYVFSCVGLVSIAEKNMTCICRNDKVSPQCAPLCGCRGWRTVRMPVHSPGLCTYMVSHLCVFACGRLELMR